MIGEQISIHNSVFKNVHSQHYSMCSFIVAGGLSVGDPTRIVLYSLPITKEKGGVAHFTYSYHLSLYISSNFILLSHAHKRVIIKYG